MLFLLASKSKWRKRKHTDREARGRVRGRKYEWFMYGESRRRGGASLCACMHTHTRRQAGRHLHAFKQTVLWIQAGIYMHSNKQFCGYRFAASKQLGFRRLRRGLAGLGANLLFGKLAVGYVMH